MPTPTARIVFSADSADARAAVNSLESELEGLETELKQNTTAADALSRQSRTTSVSVESLERQINEIRNETLQYRVAMTQLNNELAQNRNALRTADAAQKEALQTRNQAIQAEQRFLRVRQQTTAINLRQIQDQRRELLGISNSFQESARSGGIFQRSLDDIAGTIASFGVIEAAFALQQFGAAAVRSAAQLEGYERGLMLIEGSRAPERLEELIEVANLPGLQLDQLINYSNRLRAVGLTAEEVDKILLSTGQTIISFGGTSDVAAQAVEQITQAISTNTVSLQDFRSIAQRIPAFYEVIADTHMVEASIDGFRVAVENAGGSVADALIPVMDELANRFGSPPADSYVVAVDALQNSFFLLQAEIGDRLLPIIAGAANRLANFFDSIRENLDAPANAAEATEQFRVSLKNLDTQLSDVGSLENRNEGVRNYIEIVEDQIATLERLALVEADRTRRITFRLRGLDAEQLISEDDIAGILELQGELENLEGVLTGSAHAIDFFQSEADDLSQSIAIQQREISRLTTEQRQLAIAGETSSTRYRNLNDDIIQANQVLEALRSELTRYNQIVQIAEQNADASALATQLFTASQEAAAEATQQQADALVESAEAYAAYVAAASDVRQNIESLSDAQEALNSFWLMASGQVEAYNAAIQTTIPSVVSFTEAETALNAVIDAQIEAFNEANDPLSDYVDTLNLSSTAADAALSRFRGVAEATRETGGDADAAADRLRDFDDAFQLSEVTIPRTTSAMREFTGTAPDIEKVAQSIRETEDPLDVLDRQMMAIVDTTDQAETSFGEFSDAFLDNVDLMTASLDPLISRMGDTGDEIGSLIGAVTSAITGDIPGLIANIADIVLPGLTEPLRQLEFEQPAVAGGLGALQEIDFEGLALDFSGLGDALQGLDFSSLEQLGQATATSTFFQFQGPRAAQSLAERTGTDREFTENIASVQYGEVAYQAEVAAAAVEELGEAITETNEAITETNETLVDTSLALNDFQRAQFELGNATGEQDFEQRRQNLITQTNAYYDLELERINGLMLSETQLQDQREDNQLARERALRRISGITNTFTEDRIRAEEQAAAEQMRLQEEAIREAERVEQERVRAAEEAARERLEIERRTQDAISNLQQNAIQRAEFNLGLSVDEADFESNRQVLIDAINTFYDAEEERIAGLMLLEEELQDQIEDTQLARERALQRATNQTNQFTEDRIRNEEEVARAAERAAQERLAAERQLQSEISALQQNVVQRAEFNLGLSVDEADFESNRQVLIDATNAFYDAEEERIAGLELSENRLQDQREDNQLARERALRRISGITNTFTEDRIRAEEQAAAEQMRLQEEAIREAERVEQERVRAAEEAARERLEIERRTQDAISNLQQNAIQRAEFNLGLSVDEADFESNRQVLIDAINTFYDAEEERIAGLMLLEEELQDQIEDTQLARERALQRATNQTNQFTEDRIRAEQQAAAEQQRIQEETAAEAIRLQEEVARAAERAAQERLAAERQLQSEISALQQNVVQRAEFNLGLSVDEADFESNRQVLIDATNAFYDAEEERIAGLELSENRLQDQREDNQLARERALRRISGITNTFTEDRIRAEEQAAAEQMRLQEEALRESERIAAERLRAEERLANEIADLQQDAIDAEADYQDRRVDLAEDTAQRIMDIERRTLRSQEDSRIEYARDIEDLHRETTQELAELLEGLDPGQVQRATSAVLSGLGGRVSGLGLDDSTIQELLEIQQALNLDRQGLGREQRREFEDIALREERGVEDADIRQQRQLVSLGETRNDLLLGIGEDISMLVRQQEQMAFAVASTQAAPAVLVPVESVGGAGVSTPVEVAAPVSGRGGGLAGETGGGFPQEFRADITIQWSDEATSTFRDQVVRLTDQGRSL